MKMSDSARLRDGSGEFAERLGHQPRLETHVRVAHLAIELSLRNESCHGVDNQDVNRAGTNQGFGNFERLFAKIGLRDEQVVGIDAELTGIDRVEGMLGVHEGGKATGLLRLGNDLERNRRLAGRLRPEDLDDPTARALRPRREQRQRR